MEATFSGSLAVHVHNFIMKRNSLYKLPSGVFTSELEQLLVTQFSLNSIRIGRIQPLPPKSSSVQPNLSPKLQRVRANCTGIVNKLTDRVFTLESQEVFLEFFVSKLAQKSEGVENYATFVERIVSGLNGGSTEEDKL